MSLIIFSHANSFPASTYGTLFRALRARGHSVRAIEKFGHDPSLPVSNNWPNLCRQLRDFAEDAMQQAKPAQRRDTWLVGHSLGGILSAMVAARHPELAGQPVRGVVLLDSPMLGGWKARALKVAKATQLAGRVSPGKVSSRRRWHWPSRAEALAFFRGKRAFAHWHPHMLQDYVDHGLEDDGQGQGGVQLAFRREVETAIYNTLPDNLDSLFRRHPLRCPLAYVGGQNSHEGRQVGMDLTRKLAGDNIFWLPGSHLYPMERPLETAAAIDSALKALSLSPRGV